MLAAAALAAPALADGPPSAPGTVQGTVVIPTSITLSLSAQSFEVDVNPGQTANAGLYPGNPVTATVTTTDQAGYLLTESLSPAGGFTSGSATLPGSAIYPWNYSLSGGGYGGSGGFSTAFGNAGAAFPVWGASTTVTNDTVPLTWQVIAPTNAAAGNFQGAVNLLALAS
jgi:hypothetical protein